jgi:hypothetical protein
VRLLLLLLVFSGQTLAAAGRNWSVEVESVECQAAITIGLRVRYLGPAGAVEAPVLQMNGGQLLPARVSSKGSRMLAEWLSAGGLRNLKPGELGQAEVRFDAGGTSFEFGDVPAFALERKACRLQAPRPLPAASKRPADMPVHRARYPCTPSRTVAAEYPPYLPKQLVVLGRGYLPNVREVQLPMGRAPAQPYMFSGADELKAGEDAAQKAIAAHFPQYDKARYFAFNWGIQRSATGNELHSIGIYELRACPDGA